MRVIAFLLTGCLGAATCLLALFDAFDQPALADESSRDRRTEDESPALDRPLEVAVDQSPDRRPLRQPNPFAPYPTGPGARSFESLTPEERREADRSRERGDIEHGYHVHHAFKGATRFGLQRARADAAERAVDLVGAVRLGVR